MVARNHQFLGVNHAVASVWRQEELKREFPPERRLAYRVVELAREEAMDADQAALADAPATLRLVESAHPDLGKLGVFWHTQGSEKSYSMAFIAEKVRRRISAKFTFLLMTDRNDLDSQIYRTFAGCNVADKNTPRATTGEELKRLLKEKHRCIFSLIHKFNQDVDPHEPYSTRDDIIVVSDEAHRTQAGKLARNMRLALPNGAFIGFTGTPLFKNDHLTRRIFGGYVSRYDFKRSEEDGATVKLVYENRGEKLGIERLDLNDRIAEAIARANRVYPGKDFGLIVDYNGMLKSLREALAQDALGDEGGGAEEIVAPIEERVKALLAAIEETEAHLLKIGFHATRMIGAKGFTRIAAIADGVEAVISARDEGRRRFEIMARQVFVRFKALHRIVNEAIRAQDESSRSVEEDSRSHLCDLSRIDFAKLRDEFAKKVKRKAAAIEDMRKIVEEKLAQMLARNPQRMDYYRRYSEIIADYNREKDRVTMEETFANLLDLAADLSAEQQRAVKEGLMEDELALFDLLYKPPLWKATRERLKLASKSLLESVTKLIAPLERWTEKEQTKALVEAEILDHLFQVLPSPPFTDEEKQAVAKKVHEHVWQQSAGGRFGSEEVAA